MEPLPARREPRVTLQFHPDWPHGDGTVIEAMARDGRYLPQFATGTSNGGLTAHPGGDRWRWESRLFAARYDDAEPEARPVYGAWDRHGDPYGGAPRFGSAYARLRPEVVARSTFCFPDSHRDPTDVGDAALLGHLCDLADAADLDLLDDYVEAHVHGGVRFVDDVEAVVLDPCFAGTPVEDAARALGCPVERHPGVVVAGGVVDPAFRGPEVAALARGLAEATADGRLTPYVVGAAARSGLHDRQRLKQVWHCLARFGRA